MAFPHLMKTSVLPGLRLDCPQSPTQTSCVPLLSLLLPFSNALRPSPHPLFPSDFNKHLLDNVLVLSGVLKVMVYIGKADYTTESLIIPNII